MKITFNKLQKENIFCDDFLCFQKNNILEFSDRGIVVVYGPNGVGKTSLSCVLNCEPYTSFDLLIGETPYNSAAKGLFHKIPDQNGRNIIMGETEDFLLGDNIRAEHALKKEIDGTYKALLENTLSTVLKNTYNISKKTSKLISLISNIKIKRYVEDIANNQSKGKNIEIDDFLVTQKSIVQKEIKEYSKEKFDFLIKDIEDSGSVILKVLQLDGDISCNTKITEIEENDYAINLLEKFIKKRQCIICDHAIDPEILLEKKRDNRKSVFEQLDERSRKILSDIVDHIKGIDPFDIKSTLVSTIENGNIALVADLKEELNVYMQIFDSSINNLFAECLGESDLPNKNTKYKEMLNAKLKINDDDALFIEKIVSENIGKDILLKRDKDNNIKLLLNDSEFINRDRKDLHLSTGEQNFISLTFEFLKAKNISSNIIVLDDPISSFDSIYKSKIAYAILKFFETKKVLILTHNTDLIRLLECQLKDCFNLYLFNNVQGENNGFIEVEKAEQDILLYLDKMINLFRQDVFDEINDHEAFLISMIPFMRGYAQIIDDLESKNNLTKLMHGYETEKVNLTAIYNQLFGKNKPLMCSCEISVDSILGKNIDSLKILKGTKYSLLNKTLEHSLTYLFLRLKVEKTLVDIFGVNTNKYDQLGQIINVALKDVTHINERVYLTSRKTLLNEFNHFEGNMNIFQPAIDISDTTLKKEKEGILQLLSTLAK